MPETVSVRDSTVSKPTTQLISPVLEGIGSIVGVVASIVTFGAAISIVVAAQIFQITNHIVQRRRLERDDVRVTQRGPRAWLTCAGTPYAG